jgi:hypothetical protein
MIFPTQEPCLFLLGRRRLIGTRELPAKPVVACPRVLGASRLIMPCAGPALLPTFGAELAPNPLALAAYAVGLLALVLITVAMYAWASLG